MAKSTPSNRLKKRDAYTIVLEDLRSKFDLFGEALQFTNQNIVEIKSEVSVINHRLTHVEMDVSILKLDVRDLKSDVRDLKSDVAILKSDMSDVKKILHKHDESIEDHGDRITTIENA